MSWSPALLSAFAGLCGLGGVFNILSRTASRRLSASLSAMTNDPYVSPDEGTIVLIVSLPQWPPKAATSIVPPQDLGGVVTHEVKALPSGILSFHTTSVTGVNVTLRSCPVTLNGSGYVKIVSHYSHQGGTSIIDGHCVASTETGYKPCLSG